MFWWTATAGRRLNMGQRTVIGGDGLSLSIGAASIVAKVIRDRIMTVYDSLYPQYGFANHKGYGTKKHMEALAEYGPCPIHRISFKGVARSLLSRHLEMGRRGEDLAAAYLKKQGYRILDRNVNTPFGELDIVCQDKSVIVFVEVKTRATHAFGRPYEAVGPDKRRRLSRSASAWLADKDWMDRSARFDVISVTVKEAPKSAVDIEHLADAFEADG